MTFDAGEQITRLRAPFIVDPYSGLPTTRDWANAAGLPMDGFGLDPGGSYVTGTVNRTTITTTPTLYGPYAADVAQSDRVRVRGVTWDITGNRSDWANPRTGSTPGSVWPLKKVEG